MSAGEESVNKPQVAIDDVREFVHERYSSGDVAIEPITAGEVSRVYLLETPQGSQVLRISDREYQFPYDEYAEAHFAEAGVPVPRILELGKFGVDNFFSLAERVPGRTIDQLSEDEVDALVPRIIHMHDLIRGLAPEDGTLFGPIDLSNGDGIIGSWKETMTITNGLEGEEISAAEFFDTKMHSKLRQLTNGELVEALPEDRSLVHADFKYENILSDGQIVTGVIDWANVMYGDHLYDIAWLDLLDSDRDYQGLFRRHYQDNGGVPADFDERMYYYKLRIGLGLMQVFAKSRQPNKYNLTKLRVAELI